MYPFKIPSATITELLTKTGLKSPEVRQSKASAASQNATRDPSPFYSGSDILKEQVFILMLLIVRLQYNLMSTSWKRRGKGFAFMRKVNTFLQTSKLVFHLHLTPQNCLPLPLLVARQCGKMSIFSVRHIVTSTKCFVSKEERGNVHYTENQQYVPKQYIILR